MVALQELLITFRLSQNLLDMFRTTQFRLGRRLIRDVPFLDVVTTWSSTFCMVNEWYESRDVFESGCNDESVRDALPDKAMSEEDWQKMKTIADFLSTAADIITLNSATEHTTASTQPLLFIKLILHCDEVRSTASHISFIHILATTFKSKILKYKENLTLEFNMLCLALDSRFANKCKSVSEMKVKFRGLLVSTYNEDLWIGADSHRRNVFSLFNEWYHRNIADKYEGDEVDEYFDITQRPDKSFRDAAN